jgi:hypothetical protein
MIHIWLGKGKRDAKERGASVVRSVSGLLLLR